MSEKQFLRKLKSAEVVEFILTKLNINWKWVDGKYRFNSIDGTNVTTCILDIESLRYNDFKHHENGNILDLVANRVGIDKNQAISLVSTWLSTSGNDIQIKESKVSYTTDTKELIYYPDMILEAYPFSFSTLFQKDGINIATQLEFDIRYDKITNRVLIPVHQFGRLVGLFGRLNKEKLEKTDIKYLPILRYPKSMVLFGYDKNIDYVKEKGYVILVESEKSVMKAFQLGIRNVLAVGGSSISNNQIELIKQNGITNVVVLFDQDLDLNDINRNIAKFENMNFKVVNSSKLPEKCCVFDLANNKEQVFKFIKKYSIKP